MGTERRYTLEEILAISGIKGPGTSAPLLGEEERKHLPLLATLIEECREYGLEVLKKGTKDGIYCPKITGDVSEYNKHLYKLMRARKRPTRRKPLDVAYYCPNLGAELPDFAVFLAAARNSPQFFRLRNLLRDKFRINMLNFLKAHAIHNPNP
ncbi:MAG: hypothetical protein V1835_01810 [Candidatus Micrarchaeota archaeon]